MPVPILLIPAIKIIAAHYTAAHTGLAVAGHATGVHVSTTGAAAVAHTTPAAALHTTDVALGQIGSIAGKVAANHAVSGAVGHTSVIRTVTLPVHVLADPAITGSIATGGAIALSPTVSQAMSKLVTRFAIGYSVTRLKKDLGNRIDLREIKKWIGSTPANARVHFTATGEIHDGRFYALPCPADGPITFLQGTFNPRTKAVTDARVMQEVRSLSRTVRSDHRATGFAVYAPIS